MNITNAEREALERKWLNLADAHPRAPMHALEAEVFAMLPALVKACERADYIDLEQEALDAYLALSGQSDEHVHNCNTRLVFQSSSEATDVLGEALRRAGKRVLLIEPTFDNIRDLLMARGIRVLPLREHEISSDGIRAGLLSAEADCLYLVSPNNPTGRFIDEDTFRRIVGVCAELESTLVVDSSFRLFDDRACFDYYAPCLTAGTDFIIIEDTGKFWSTLDLKVGSLVGNTRHAPLLRTAHSNLLLGVSPLVLTIVRKLCELGGAELVGHVREKISNGRALVRELLSGADVDVVTADSRVSVELIDVSRIASSEAVVREAAMRRLGVLSARRFYWDEARRTPVDQIRIALSRSHEDLLMGVTILREVLTKLQSVT